MYLCIIILQIFGLIRIYLYEYLAIVLGIIFNYMYGILVCWKGFTNYRLVAVWIILLIDLKCRLDFRC